VYNLVVVQGESNHGLTALLAGRLNEPFSLKERTGEVDREFDVASLVAGRDYPGPIDHAQGTFKLRQRHGGVIEARRGSTSVFAVTDSGNADPRIVNGRRVLDAWRSLGKSGLTFYVNRLGHAWFREHGEAKFLAAAPDGFCWPESPRGEKGSGRSSSSS
jgi:hypothetical protein